MARLMNTNGVNTNVDVDMIKDLKSVLSSYGYKVEKTRNAIADCCEQEKDILVPILMETLEQKGYEPTRTGRGDVLFKVGLQEVHNWRLELRNNAESNFERIIEELGGKIRIEHDLREQGENRVFVTGTIPVIMHLNLSCRTIVDDADYLNENYNRILEYAESRKQRKLIKAIETLLNS